MSRESSGTVRDELESLCVAYRHDVHKLFGRSHGSGVDEFGGVPVNEAVPLGADGDAAMLSRPAGEPEQTVANHVSPFRLSLLTGSTVGEARQLGGDSGGVERLVVSSDAERLHAAWLTSSLAAEFNESVYYPYTSLKFHTLLVAALLDNYRAGYAFDELFLAATPGLRASDDGVEAVLQASEVVPHRTVCWTPAVALHVTGEPGGRPAALLGSAPAMSFADVWSRLPVCPLNVDGDRGARVLDAQFRRVRSWSSALQLIEDAARGVGALSQWGESRE